MMKNTEQDAVRLGEQRPGVGSRAIVGAVNGLLMEASAAAILYLIYEAVRFFMR